MTTTTTIITAATIVNAIQTATIDANQAIEGCDRFMGSCRVYVEIYSSSVKQMNQVAKACEIAGLIYYKPRKQIYMGYRNGIDANLIRKATAIAKVLKELGLSAYVEYTGD